MVDGAQIPLPLKSSVLPSFANFVTGQNIEVVSALRTFAKSDQESLLYLYGLTGTGVSHLLQSSAFLATELGNNAFYLSLSEPGLKADILQGLNSFDVLYIDDLNRVAGLSQWDEGLFHLYNQYRDEKKSLIIAAKTPPLASGVILADLKSRLSAMICYQLKKLSDDEKSAAIILKAQSYGLKLNQDVAHFILRRGPRDMQQLMTCINRLEQASLVSKRAITIPFVKDILGW